MQVYSHTNYVLRGYSRLTHEAIIFERDHTYEVSAEIGEHLLGTYPLQFCYAEADASPSRCPHRYQHGMMEAPVEDRMMVPQGGRGRPRKVSI